MGPRTTFGKPIRFSQTGQSSVLPVRGDTPDTFETEGQRNLRFPDQWLLTAKTQEPAREVCFLAMFAPYRESEKESVIEDGEGARGEIRHNGMPGEGRTVVQAAATAQAGICA